MKTILTCVMCTTTLAHAAILIGAGDNLPLPSLPHNTPVEVEVPVISTVSGGFAGTWSSPADAAWHGTFSATGSQPLSSNTGSNTWDFTGMNSSYLPSGSFFYLSDLDESSSSTITFKAYDSGGSPITAWLDEPFATIGSGLGPGGVPLLTNMPSWEWNAASSSYIFDGGEVSGNPALGVYLLTNQPISTLETTKLGTSNNFGIYAPTVPEPSTTLLMGLGGVSFLLRRKRH
ncbi:MAG: PEP-CTERM sorting domain-containing protein [Akkermansiaceae bacterium]